jgi:hypothetical protein
MKHFPSSVIRNPRFSSDLGEIPEPRQLISRGKSILLSTHCDKKKDTEHMHGLLSRFLHFCYIMHEISNSETPGYINKCILVEAEL